MPRETSNAMKSGRRSRRVMTAVAVAFIAADPVAMGFAPASTAAPRRMRLGGNEEQVDPRGGAHDRTPLHKAGGAEGGSKEEYNRGCIGVGPLRMEAADRTAGGGTAALELQSRATRAVQDASARLDDLYNQSIRIKCPFFRRRAADLIDGAATVLRFLLIRHKTLGIFDPFFDADDGILADRAQPPGCKAAGRHVAIDADGTSLKHRHLGVAAVADVIRSDWTEGAAGVNKGYYITGSLNSTVYRDDCLFDGPDPDQPVRGLRKYLSAASHLFETQRSYADLLSLDFDEDGGKAGHGVVTVRWRLGGVLMLPWRPVVKPWTGSTRYHLDDDGLVYFHEEGWDISVMEAFVCTVFPELGEKVWGSGGGGDVVSA